MKAQSSKKSDTPGCLDTTDKRDSSWSLPSGLLLADSGLFLIAFAGWEALRANSQTLLYSCGALLCFAGLVLIWIGTTPKGSAVWTIKKSKLFPVRLLPSPHTPWPEVVSKA
jgi:hypothetical protein